ncbi:SWI/SNF-related matrix-associated actin-dependent regulator of chromatin subfamily E member 1-like isoform X2 [Rhodnius prolixus]|uniref:SWI/SNF-related matrix-associated actin-dependent regulator of chromatin subfamily E member 1-like isoform X2 n=1 Tax=Rhodnius prolixus TaxID=13249 RepID=UPI003D18E8DC
MNSEEWTIFRAPRLGSNTNFIPRKMINKRSLPPNLPSTPFMRFSKANMDKLLEYYPDSKPWNVGRLMGQLWRELPEKEKQPYFDAYKAAKSDYDKKLKLFLTATSRNCYTDQESYVKDAPSNESSTFSENEEFGIEPAEDETDLSDDSFAEIRKAHSRYVRNNLLMKVIFSDTKVFKDEITNFNERFERLKKSGNTLEAYLKKRLAEVHNLEQIHEQRMKEIQESNANFQKQLRQNMVYSKLINWCSLPPGNNAEP